MSTDELLSQQMLDLAEQAPHDDALARAVIRRSRRRRIAVAAPVAVAAAVGLIVGGIAVFRPAGRTAQAEGLSTCRPLTEQVIPDWARAGFSDPEPKAPLVYSADGQLVAIVFGVPLTSPASADHINKILWTAQDTEFVPDFQIVGTLEGSTRTMTMTLDGAPGPRSSMSPPRAVGTSP